MDARRISEIEAEILGDKGDDHTSPQCDCNVYYITDVTYA